MEWRSDPQWWSAIAAVVSIVFAVFSWWHSHASSKAREQAAEENLRAKRHEQLAEEAARRADESLAEVRRQTEALEALAERSRLPDITATRDPKNDKILVLTNNSHKSITVAGVDNADKWLRLNPRDGFPFTVAADHGTAEIVTVTALGLGGDHHLVLRLENGRVVNVPLSGH